MLYSSDETIKLSVLVTFCNQKQFIKPAIDSIINQNVNFKYEILICLDNDTDDSESVLLEYSGKNNIRYFKTSSPKNLIPLSRASHNRMLLLQKSNGEYITFLDGDDFYINSNKFQKSIDFLEKNLDYIGFAHAHKLFDHKNDCFLNIISPYSKATNIYLEKFIHDNCYLFSNDIIFRNIFKYDNVKYISELYLNDTTLTFWLLNYGKIFFTPIPMLGYRVNINSIYSSKPILEKKINELILCEEHYHLFNKQKKFFRHKIIKTINNILKIKEISDLDIYLYQIRIRNLYITQNILLFIKSVFLFKIYYKFKIKFLLFFM